MKRYLFVAAWLIGSTLAPAAQDAAQLAAQRDAEERERRLNNTIEELRRANVLQQQRINELINEINALHRRITDLDNRFKNSQVTAVTRDDLRKAYDKMGEIEKARQADKTLILEEVRKIAELAARAPQVIHVPAPAPIAAPPAAATESDAPPENPGGYYTYTIQKGDTLLGVIGAYNAKLKEEGKKPITLDQVKKANPKVNPNSLMVGKEILIPVPPDK